MTKITPQPGILDIELYQGGASHITGVTNVTKLSSNENPFGPSDAVKDAYRKLQFELHRYPSSDHAELRAAIGSVHGVDATGHSWKLGKTDSNKKRPDSKSGRGITV